MGIGPTVTLIAINPAKEGPAVAGLVVKEIRGVKELSN